jgi:xylulokinase
MQAALPVEESGAALRPSIIWADQRATVETAELIRRVPAASIYAISGHRPSASYSAAKIMWIRKNEPEIFRRAWKFLHAKDFIVLRLTGRACTDLSDASGMNLLDIGEAKWSSDLLDAAGIPASLLPELHESTNVVGKVTSAASSASGLIQGTPVVIGGGDGACATCGAGVVAPGDAYICMGTSGWVAMASDKPLRDPGERIGTYCHFRKGLYFPCAGALAWFVETTAAEEKREDSMADRPVYDILEAKAARVSPGSEGLLFLPYLIGERSPWWNSDARGCFIGLSLSHGQGHMARAIMEGVACNLRLIADVFTELGMHARDFRLIGGGARSRTWRGILADVLDRRVTTLSFMEEATSVGAAIAGGVGVGLFESMEEAARIVTAVESIEPDPQRALRYRQCLPVFTSAYRQLAPVFGMLAALNENALTAT